MLYCEECNVTIVSTNVTTIGGSFFFFFFFFFLKTGMQPLLQQIKDENSCHKLETCSKCVLFFLLLIIY